MAQETVTRLSHVFTWSDVRSGITSATSATYGTLVISSNSEPIWGSHTFEWAWVELLEWLSENWLALTVDDGTPLIDGVRSTDDLINPSSGTRVRSSIAETDAMALWEFREAHDVAHSMSGVSAPPLYIWREGLIGHVMTEARHNQFHWNDLRTFLISVGNEVAERISTFGMDERGAFAINAWRVREDVDPESIFEQSMKVPAEQFASVLKLMPAVSNGQSLSDIVVRNEIVAAARMISDLDEDVVVRLLSELHRVDLGDSSKIDALSQKIRATWNNSAGLRPYEEGHHVAHLTRLSMELTLSEPLDVHSWLKEHGVEYREVSLGVEGIDAIAAWGMNHGPVIVVNTDGLHTKSRGGRNITIAHEIGHIIMDRFSALPAAEVLRGSVSSDSEQRVKAFAAELLLPASRAREAFFSDTSPSRIAETVKELAGKYGVSQEVVAWQARNADRELPTQVRKVLRSFVSEPFAY